jgi:AcrR family transcriptional regulator
MPDETLDRPAWEPWKRLGTEQYRRRYALYALAAPVLERHGYRGATIRALAHACHLSPAGLLHHFGSKRALATYPLHAPRMSWETTWVDPHADPLLQLRMLLEMSVRNLPLYLLAMRMEEEAGGSLDSRTQTEAFREGEVVIGRLVHAVEPAFDRERAVALGRDLLSVLIGSAVAGLDPEPLAAARQRMIALLRASLVPGSISAAAFDAVMHSGETEQIG